MQPTTAQLATAARLKAAVTTTTPQYARPSAALLLAQAYQHLVRLGDGNSGMALAIRHHLEVEQARKASDI